MSIESPWTEAGSTVPTQRLSRCCDLARKKAEKAAVKAQQLADQLAALEAGDVGAAA
ncbi:hypothetical protein [Peterkaempfera bronchialis]|uniref:hypothetical protein n=1 Tax=Peterkaempfera bronchialis TaxID=2126346 RepID=UPI0013B3EECC|nr:hypothetical protein [Peterkaempfera bronchialis]